MRSWILVAALVLLVAPVRAKAEYYDYDLNFDLSYYSDYSSYGSYGYSGYDTSYGYGGCGGSYSGCGGDYSYAGLYGSSWGAADTSLSYLVGIDVSVDLGSYYGYGAGDLYGYGYGGGGWGGYGYDIGIGYDIGCSIGYCGNGILPYPQPIGVIYPLPPPLPPAPSCNVCTPIQNPYPIGYPPTNPVPQPIPQPVTPALPGPIGVLPVGEIPQIPSVRPPYGGCTVCPGPNPVRPIPTIGVPTLPTPQNPVATQPQLPGAQPIGGTSPSVPGTIGLPPSHGSGNYVPGIQVIGTPPDRNRVPRTTRLLP